MEDVVDFGTDLVLVLTIYDLDSAGTVDESREIHPLSRITDLEGRFECLQHSPEAPQRFLHEHGVVVEHLPVILATVSYSKLPLNPRVPSLERLCYCSVDSCQVVPFWDSNPAAKASFDTFEIDLSCGLISDSSLARLYAA